jgi:hypothetical protein
MASLSDFTKTPSEPDQWSVRAERLRRHEGRMAALPGRDQLPFRRLEAATRGLTAARKALTEAEREFEEASAECREAFGLDVRMRMAEFEAPGDPPMMPVE